MCKTKNDSHAQPISLPTVMSRHRLCSHFHSVISYCELLTHIHFSTVSLQCLAKERLIPYWQQTMTFRSPLQPLTASPVATQ
jgi:hypothetical protein